MLNPHIARALTAQRHDELMRSRHRSPRRGWSRTALTWLRRLTRPAPPLPPGAQAPETGWREAGAFCLPAREPDVRD